MLTDLLIKNATANGKDYKLSDSGGLHLFVSKSGHRSWRLKYRFGGKERRLMIGSYPDVSLKEARERRNVARTLLVNGRDPGIEAQRAKVERTLAAANDFETVARAWFELQKGRWTPIHASDVINSLEKAVFPWIGKLPVKEIDEPLLLSVLRKVERRGAIETAHRVRQRISAIFVHAIAEGMVARDPATVITKALKPVPRSRKGPALLALDALHDLIRKTECEPASPITKLASRFMALTAQRPGMIRALPWSEIENVDFESDHEARTALWRIPAQRMKLVLELKSDQGYEHIVPLASQAVAVLMRVGEFLRTLVMQACDTGLGESQTERQLARIETDQCFAAVALDALLAGHPDPDMRSRAHAAFIRKTERRRRLEASGEGDEL